MCLSLLLHQLTLSLTDVLVQITNESLSPIDSEEDLRVIVRKRLKDQENTGFIELEKNKVNVLYSTGRLILVIHYYKSHTSGADPIFKEGGVLTV